MDTIRAILPHILNMFTKSKKGAASWCTLCTVTNIVVGVLAVILALVAVVGLYQAHMLSSGPTFGTTSGSMSIIALAISLFLMKKAASACGCQCTLPSKK